MKTKLLPTTQGSIRKLFSPGLIRFLLILALCPAPCALRQALAQVPQGFNYQAIARDGSGNPIVGATIKVKLSILTDTTGFRAGTGGAYLWEEEHSNVSTNAFGLFNIVLGDPLAIKTDGSAASFSVINWSVSNLYIGTKIANPTTYKVLGAAKLWSVPYALRAKDTDQWQVNGANIYRQTGNLGIGTNNPGTYKLNVSGGPVLIGDGTGISGTLKLTGHSYIGSADWGNLSLSSGVNGGSSVITLNTENQTRVIIGGNGNVGIGTLTPGQKLTVAGSFSATSASYTLMEIGGPAPSPTNGQATLYLHHHGSIAHQLRYTSGKLFLEAAGNGYGTSATPELQVNGGLYAGINGGNVGIGTIAPGEKMEIGGINSKLYLNSATSNMLFFNQQGVAPPSFSTRSAGTKIVFYPNVGASTTDFGMGIENGTLWYSVPIANSTVAHKFYGGTTELLRIRGDGNVGIGTASPAYKLDVVGRIRLQTGGGSAGLWVMNNANTAERSFIGMYSDDYVGVYGAGLANWGMLMNVNNGNVGIGTPSPTSKVVIQPSATWDDNVPLFEVKNKYGTPVLAVYNNGVRILVAHDAAKGVTKGGFAIGGFDNTKALGETVNLMTVAPDSIRFNIDNDNTKGITKGGFAIGSFDVTKGINVNPKGFMNMTPLGSTTGQYNTFIGFQSGAKNSSSGIKNTFIGYEAGYSNTLGDYNVYIGNTAGRGGNGSYNVYIGDGAGATNSGTFNAFLGKGAGGPSTGVDWSTLLGFSAGGSLTTADYNLMIGAWAGTFTTTGEQNTLIGTYSGFSNQVGNYNTFIGQSTGETVTGSGNVLLGYKAGQNEGAIDNKLYINNGPGGSPLIYGDFTTNYIKINGSLYVTTMPLGDRTNVQWDATSKQFYYDNSSRRSKENIIPLIDDFDKLLLAEPKRYTRPNNPGVWEIGYIAEEFEELGLKRLLWYDEEGLPESINYDKIILYSNENIKRNAQRISKLEEENAELRLMVKALMEDKNEIAALKEMVKELQIAAGRRGR